MSIEVGKSSVQVRITGTFDPNLYVQNLNHYIQEVATGDLANCTFSFAGASQENGSTTIRLNANNTSSSVVAWPFNVASINTEDSTGQTVGVTSTFLKTTSQGDSQAPILSDIPSELFADIWLQMGHGQTYVDAADSNKTKILNFGSNGTKGYLLNNGLPVDGVSSRKIDYGNGRGWRGPSAAGSTTAGPVIRIPAAHIDIQNDFTIALLYSNRREAKSTSWHNIATFGTLANNALCYVRQRGNTPFSSEIGSVTSYTTSLSNMGKGSLILRRESGVLSVWVDGVKLANSTVWAGAYTLDHCLGGGVNASSAYFGSQIGVFEFCSFSYALADLQIDLMHKHFGVAAKRNVVLFDGQSNNNGQGYFSELGEKDRVQKIVSKYDAFRNARWENAGSSGSTFGPWFEYQRLTNKSVVISGRNGTAISAWIPGNEINLSEQIYDGFAKAWWADPCCLLQVERVFFSQGETDAEASTAGSTYPTRFTDYVAYRRQLANNASLKVTTPLLPTDSTMPYTADVNTAKLSVDSADGNVSTVVLGTGNLHPDNVHIDTQGQIALGTLFAGVA